MLLPCVKVRPWIVSCGWSWFWQCDVVQICAWSHVFMYRMRRWPAPLSVTLPPPSSTTTAEVLTTFAVSVITMVTGSGPQLNVMIPPSATASTTACDVQLGGVPVPITRSGCEVSTGRASSGNGTPVGVGGDGGDNRVAVAVAVAGPSIAVRTESAVTASAAASIVGAVPPTRTQLVASETNAAMVVARRFTPPFDHAASHLRSRRYRQAEMPRPSRHEQGLPEPLERWRHDVALPDAFLLLNFLGEISRRVSSSYGTWLRPFGIDFSEYVVLWALRLLEPKLPSVSDLRARVVMSSGGIARAEPARQEAIGAPQAIGTGRPRGDRATHAEGATPDRSTDGSGHRPA